MTEQIFHIKNKKEMANLAQKLAKNAKKGDIFTLEGNLGSGKTFFAQEFINFFSNKKIDVTSPTFNLLSVYELEKNNIYHFDLYRLKDEEELFNLGIEDALIDGITLIEWPELAKDFLKNPIKIYIEIIQEEERLVKLFD